MRKIACVHETLKKVARKKIRKVLFACQEHFLVLSKALRTVLIFIIMMCILQLYLQSQLIIIICCLKKILCVKYEKKILSLSPVIHVFLTYFFEAIYEILCSLCTTRRHRYKFYKDRFMFYTVIVTKQYFSAKV